MNKFEYKKRLFNDRIDNFINLPNEIKNKLTNEFLTDTLLMPRNQDNPERIDLIHEIGEIINELEVFERTNRRKRMVILMERIADVIDDDLICEDELTDKLFFGNKISNIENEYINRERIKKMDYFDNQMCKQINNILEDDDKNAINLVKMKRYRKIIGYRKDCHKCGKKLKNKKYRCIKCKYVYHYNCMEYKIIKRKKICLECYN